MEEVGLKCIKKNVKSNIFLDQEENVKPKIFPNKKNMESKYISNEGRKCEIKIYLHMKRKKTSSQKLKR